MTPDSPPGLSVIVATHNRHEALRRCLESLCDQTCDPSQVEVIVADDGSTDGTAEMAASLSAPFALRVMRLDKAGQAAAQNEAIQASRGHACLFIDDDTIASRELIAEHLAAQGASGAGLLGIGALTQRPPDGRDWYAQTFAAAWAEHYDDLATRPARWFDCYGANFSAPRVALVEAGGFATDLPRTVDLELAFRLSEAGLAPTFLPRAHCVHDDQKGRRRLLVDAGLQGAGHVELARRHPATTAQMLDWVETAGPKELFLRRLLIALRIPPGPLAAAGALLPGAGRKMLWMHLVKRLAFWRAARREMTREQWTRLTHPSQRVRDEPVSAKAAS